MTEKEEPKQEYDILQRMSGPPLIVPRVSTPVREILENKEEQEAVAEQHKDCCGEEE